MRHRQKSDRTSSAFTMLGGVIGSFGNVNDELFNGNVFIPIEF
jgi:hypothetical protein